MESEINPAKIIFVTGNLTKFAEAQMVAKQYGIHLQVKDLEIIEIQSNDPEVVVQAKVKTACQILKCPVVAHDSSWSIPSLNGFPGAYMHDIAHWFEPNDWLNLMSGHSDQTIEVCENLAYYDGHKMKCFQYRQQGTFVNSPRGIKGNSLEKVVTLANGKTIAEHHDINIKNNSVTLQVWAEFCNWYIELITKANHKLQPKE